MRRLVDTLLDRTTRPLPLTAKKNTTQRDLTTLHDPQRSARRPD